MTWIHGTVVITVTAHDYDFQCDRIFTGTMTAYLKHPIKDSLLSVC